MNDLDLSTTWLHLRKVPISRNRVSLEVCSKLKDRLEQVALYAQDQSILSFMTTSPHCPRLLKMDVATCHLLLTMDGVRSIHGCAPLLRELSLMVCMENTSDTPPALPLLDRRMHHIQELKCLIHHPDSAWFPIIKSTYYDIDKLTMVISNITPRHAGYSARQHTKFEIVRALIDLIKSTTIRELEMDFKFVDDISFLQAATATLLYDQCNNLTMTMPVSIKASFVGPGDFDCHHRFLANLTTPNINKEESNKVHHQLEYRFIREFDEDNDEHNVSELDLLAYTIIRPINKLVAELSLDIGTGGIELLCEPGITDSLVRLVRVSRLLHTERYQIYNIEYSQQEYHKIPISNWFDSQERLYRQVRLPVFIQKLHSPDHIEAY
ncbi:hypothetical protein MBANPS3_007478 [Mucor bainieri]